MWHDIIFQSRAVHIPVQSRVELQTFFWHDMNDISSFVFPDMTAKYFFMHHSCDVAGFY